MYLRITRKLTNELHYIPFVYYQSNMFQPEWPSSGIILKLLKLSKPIQFKIFKCKQSVKM